MRGFLNVRHLESLICELGGRINVFNKQLTYIYVCKYYNQKSMNGIEVRFSEACHLHNV